ncbi:hypothetical protein [Nitrosopumilus sp.]|uniref:hypothetical protein n=1 Tax=Nitrosopumilus sp. TaxID=2024843 RepID=UPI00292D1C06|nr:hypothetical protein [Nitrosopumilus sp.]
MYIKGKKLAKYQLDLLFSSAIAVIEHFLSCPSGIGKNCPFDFILVVVILSVIN